MPSKRPNLTAKLDPKVFGNCYWEVKELAAFCREQGLSTSGVKADLTQRIKDFLSGHLQKTAAKAKRNSGPRDSSVAGGLKLTTPVQNYNSDAITRDFFRKHCGKDFRFNEYLRSFSKGVPGGKELTYGDLIKGWRDAEDQRSQGKQQIGKQFEYNQFTRDFYSANPGGGRDEMMNAWRTVRSSRETAQAVFLSSGIKLHNHS